MSYNSRKKFIDLSFWFSRAWLSGLAILVFAVDVGTNLYTNIQASDDSFAQQRDAKLQQIKNSPEALRLLEKANAISGVAIRKSEQMVESNNLAIDEVKSGKRRGSSVDLWDGSFDKALDKANTSDDPYKAHIERESKPIWDEYNQKVERKKLTTVTGLATGIAVGVLLPTFSLFLMAMSTKPYDTGFKNRCKIGGYGAQLLSSVVTAIAIDKMFDSLLLGIGFGIVLLWCAPLLYEAVALERQRKIQEKAERVKIELESEKAKLELVVKQRANDQEDADKQKRQSNKTVSEKSRMQNLVQAAEKLINPVSKNPVLKGVPKDSDKAARWFVENGEPYGLQIKLSEHCGESKSSFNRKVEQFRAEFGKVDGKVESKNGKLESVGH